MLLAIGNDGQFSRFVAEAGATHLSHDPRFATNAARVRHREALVPLIADLTKTRSTADWLAACTALNIPAGPVNTLDQIFASPQVAARQMRITLPHPVAASGTVDLIGNPLKFSETPVRPTKAPPQLGQDSASVLARLLDLDAQSCAELAAQGVIAGQDKA